MSKRGAPGTGSRSRQDEVKAGNGARLSGNVNMPGGTLVGRDSYTVYYSLPKTSFYEKGEIPRQVVAPGRTYVSRPALETPLQELLLAEPGSPFVFVYGLPGTGLFFLARQVVNEPAVLERFKDGTLYCDLSGVSLTDVLFRLIQPFEPDMKFDPRLSKEDYIQKLRGIFAEKQILIVARRARDERQLQSLEFNLPGVTVLALSNQRFPDYDQGSRFVEVSDMSKAEAVSLVKSCLADFVRSEQYEESILEELARELHYTPAKIAIAIRNIRQMNVSPAEYLEELKTQVRENKTGEFEWARAQSYLEKVYQSLPALSQQIFPYLGVFGAGHITASALATISRRSRHEVIQCLNQLRRFGLVETIESEEAVIDMKRPYDMRERVRDFALHKLRERVGDNAEISIKVLRALMANYYLEQAADRLLRGKKNLLIQLSEEDETVDFLDTLRNNQELFALPLADQIFDEILSRDERLWRQWSKFLMREEIKQLRIHLEEALDWAIAQEDWELVRRFVGANIRGAFTFQPVEPGEGRAQVEGEMPNRRFVHIHDFNFSGREYFNFEMKAICLCRSEIQNSTIASSRFLGAQVRQGNWEDVDLIGLEAPAIHFASCQLVDVDARMADLRGALFENCHFENVDFRGSRLGGAVFHHCILVNCDFRRREEKPIYISDDTQLIDVRGI